MSTSLEICSLPAQERSVGALAASRTSSSPSRDRSRSPNHRLAVAISGPRTNSWRKSSACFSFESGNGPRASATSWTAADRVPTAVHESSSAVRDRRRDRDRTGDDPARRRTEVPWPATPRGPGRAGGGRYGTGLRWQSGAAGDAGAHGAHRPLDTGHPRAAAGTPPPRSRDRSTRQDPRRPTDSSADGDPLRPPRAERDRHPTADGGAPRRGRRTHRPGARPGRRAGGGGTDGLPLRVGGRTPTGDAAVARSRRMSRAAGAAKPGLPWRPVSFRSPNPST